MPTAVERGANFLSNILKLNAIDNRGAEAAFPILAGQVDAGITALGDASSRQGFAAADRTYGEVFAGLGYGAFGLGADLQRDAFVFDIVNLVLGGTNAFGGGGGSGTQADFGTLDRALFGAGGDLETFGADFASLGRVRSQTAFTTLETKLQGDATMLAGDFSALGGDLGTLVSDLDGGANAVTTAPSPYAALAAVLTGVETQFSTIGTDFAGLAKAFGGGGGSGSPILTASVLSTASSGGGGAGTPYGTAFTSLDTDFLALDKSFQSLGAPLANLLLPAVSSPTTT